MAPTTISRSQIKTVARIAALHNGTAPTHDDGIRRLFNDTDDHFDWYFGEGTPPLTDADVNAIRLEKEVQLDRIRAFFNIDNCGY